MVNNRNKQLRLLSLFSGCGGMDLGFEGDFDVLKDSVNMARNSDWIDEKKSGDFWVHLKKNRFSTVFANDIRPDAQAAWQRYFSTKKDKSVYRLQSVVDLVKNEKEGKAHVFPENIDIVTGGFPCQDFSVAGKRLGFNSDKRHDGKKINDDDFPSVESRGQLYMWMREVISLTQPKMFVAENVKGLVSLSDAKETIERDFENISENGYLVVDAKVLHAADYGVPQKRERIYIVCIRKDAGGGRFAFPEPVPLRRHLCDLLLPDSEAACKTQKAILNDGLESLFLIADALRQGMLWSEVR